MTLLFPLGLLALGALLVPLLIHLARRTPYTPLDFAALRWLRAQQRPRQRIRFDDWPLLLVRLLLLAALAVLLARPAMTGPEPVAPAWTVVAPGLDAQALRGNDNAKHWHWLAPGFPPIEEAAPAATASVPSLLRELDAQLPPDTQLTAYVPDPLPDLDGARLQLSRPLQWHPVSATPVRADASRAAPRLRPAATTSAATLRWLAALQQAWNQQPLAATLTAEAVPEPGEIGVWASKEPLPAQWQAWLQHGGILLTATPAPQQAQVVLRDAHAAPLLLQQRDGQGRLLHLLGEWNPSTHAALRDPSLPRQLLLALQGEPIARLGDAQDHTPMLTQLPMPQPAPRELAPWLIGLILLLFALERWMASAPRRRQPA